jgi:acetolactate synthase-1/3 small subunit
MALNQYSVPEEKYLMTPSHTLSVFAGETHGLLSKIILLFTRRRIRVEQMNYVLEKESGMMSLKIKFAEHSCKADNLVKQVEKIIEVVSVKLENNVSAVPEQLMPMTFENLQTN